MKDQNKHDRPSIVMLVVLAVSLGVALFAWLQFRLHPTPEAFFAYCVAGYAVAIIATVRAVVATMRHRPWPTQVGDWILALFALSYVVDLFAITTLGHRVIWGWLPSLP